MQTGRNSAVHCSWRPAPTPLILTYASWRRPPNLEMETVGIKVLKRLMPAACLVLYAPEYPECRKRKGCLAEPFTGRSIDRSIRALLAFSSAACLQAAPGSGPQTRRAPSSCSFAGGTGAGAGAPGQRPAAPPRKGYSSRGARRLQTSPAWQAALPANLQLPPGPGARDAVAGIPGRSGGADPPEGRAEIPPGPRSPSGREPPLPRTGPHPRPFRPRCPRRPERRRRLPPAGAGRRQSLAADGRAGKGQPPGSRTRARGGCPGPSRAGKSTYLSAGPAGAGGDGAVLAAAGRAASPGGGSLRGARSRAATAAPRAPTALRPAPCARAGEVGQLRRGLGSRCEQHV